MQFFFNFLNCLLWLYYCPGLQQINQVPVHFRYSCKEAQNIFTNHDKCQAKKQNKNPNFIKMTTKFICFIVSKPIGYYASLTDPAFSSLKFQQFAAEYL